MLFSKQLYNISGKIVSKDLNENSEQQIKLYKRHAKNFYLINIFLFILFYLDIYPPDS